MLLIVTTAMQVFWTSLMIMYDVDLGSSDLGLAFSVVVPMYLCAVPLFLLMRGWAQAPVQIWKDGIPEIKSLGVGKNFGFGGWVAIVVISLGTVYIGNFVGMGVMKLFEVILGRSYGNELDALVGETSPNTVLVLMVILAPIIEEVLFRKVLLDRLKLYDERTGICLSAYLFGIVHGNFWQFFYAFALGLIFAYVYTKTRKVHHTILLHMMINFIGGYIPSLTAGLPEDSGLLQTANTVMGLVAMAAMAATVVLLIVLRKRIRLRKGVAAFPDGHVFRRVYLNPGMLLFSAVGFALFAASVLAPA
jgi:membrane protease YdiL (CAAX protease family)